jgi:hypothetical protein
MVEDEPDRVVLSDRVVKAATRVCAKKAFLDRLRQEWGLLRLISTWDRKQGNASGLEYRAKWRKGRSPHSWRSRSRNAFFAQTRVAALTTRSDKTTRSGSSSTITADRAQRTKADRRRRRR